MKKMDYTQQTMLAPFADAFAGMDQLLAGKSTAELRELKKACKAVTPTNCWAATYHAAKIIEPLIDAWLYQGKLKPAARSTPAAEGG